MMRALALCLLAGARAFVWPHASKRGGCGRSASASVPNEDEEGLMVTIAKVRRPLGVILEEREGGRGVEVLDIDPRGNAAGEDVLVGDRLQYQVRRDLRCRVSLGWGRAANDDDRVITKII